MKILFIGDFESNTGPASVNKAFKKVFDKDIMYSTKSNMIQRVIELIWKTRKSEYIIFSGISKINVIGYYICKIYNKKYIYLMHGCVKYEHFINGTKDNNLVKVENFILNKADKIVCVSQVFMEWMKENYPEYNNKITYVNNPIEWESINNKEENKIERDINTILSVGGGLPRKNIKKICEAIEKINMKYDKYLKLVVIGKLHKDSEEIKKFPFVTYIEEVDKQDMIKYYGLANVYIQNSIFETFGLAIIEALLGGCNILISKHVGVKGIIDTLDTDDIIYNVNDIDEISEKIIKVIEINNNNKLLKGIDREKTTILYAYNRLKEEISCE